MDAQGTLGHHCVDFLASGASIVAAFFLIFNRVTPFCIFIAATGNSAFFHKY
jgi:hypothetical protein